MLKLKNITKNYGQVQALKDVSLTFRDTEFVSILGQSGSGKTTLLNIVGGLDRYTYGDLIIDGQSTETYTDKQWDAYRNSSVGFVFQSYNLIPHLTVLQNVELSMKLSGIGKQEAHKRAEEALIKVGLHDQINKKPNQMSGGQMQRVAIARALVNDPDIILADEPTGALDSKTSVVVMDLLKEISKEKLVIMVTHNAELAHTYSSRIVEFLDGEMVSDSNPVSNDIEEESNHKQVMTAMPYRTALTLSGRNLWAKKGRTILTSIAGSIGIIGIALVLALSTGLSNTIKTMQEETLASSPITIEQTAMDYGMAMSPNLSNPGESYPDSTSINVYDPMEGYEAKKNVITADYIDYVRKLDPNLYISIQESTGVSMNWITQKGSNYELVQTGQDGVGELLNNDDFNNRQYDVIAGKMPTNQNEIVVVVDEYNRIPKQSQRILGIEGESFDATSIVGKEYKLIEHNDFYQESAMGIFPLANTSQYETLFNSDTATTLTVSGVLRKSEASSVSMYSPGLYYTEALSKDFATRARQSNVVAKQLEVKDLYSVVSGQPIANANPFMDSEQVYNEVLASLGGSDVATKLAIIPKDFETKSQIRDYLDAYNQGREKPDQITYTDMSEIMTNIMDTMVNTISYVLIGFSSISLVVSSFMIGIITYVSVIERTKEIGVLRSLGARKKDISRVFNAETFLIGLVSGTFGIVVTYLLQFPINAVVYDLTGAQNIANLSINHALILIAISITLTFIAGFIPSKMAAKKDPVVALRSE